MPNLFWLLLFTSLVVAPAKTANAEGNCGAGGWIGAGEVNECSNGGRSLTGNNLKSYLNETAAVTSGSTAGRAKSSHTDFQKGKSVVGTVSDNTSAQPTTTRTASSSPSSPPPSSSSSGGINCSRYAGTMYDSCMRINERNGKGGGSATGTGKYPDVGGNGILWKPTSDSDGKLVVLTKTSLGTPTVEILDANGNVIEKGRYVYHANGNRAHYRFSKSGRSYPNGSLLRVNGKIYEVPQTWKRYE